MTEQTWKIEPLDQTHDRGAFNCGVQFMDRYIAKRCLNDHELHKARMYVATEPDQKAVVGYYTLSLLSLKPEDTTPEAAQDKFGTWAIPLVYLGQIGVHEPFQGGKGVGDALMFHAFKRTLDIAYIAGTYGLALDAIDERRARWYEDRDFERYGLEDDGRIKMVCPLGTITEAVAAVS